MSKPVISASRIGKKYRVGARQKESLTTLEALVNVVKSPFRNFRQIRSLSNTESGPNTIHWALKDISFNVEQGQVLGIIGSNGAGKSTLLKILSRITDPSEGEIMMRGRVSSLLEVGTGFHPELTGRDNIYMNGTILGMRKKEIDLKFDEIVGFSGVEQYIDTPVKFYSSGMKVRLAFSVAAHLDPEILIIDEVLAVGDAEFQKRCLQKMDTVAGQGRTILFVSHDLGAIQNLCHHAIFLRQGTMAFMGDVRGAIDMYLGGLSGNGSAGASGRRYGAGGIVVDKIALVNTEKVPVQDVMTGQSFYIQLFYSSKYPDQLPSFTYFHIFIKNAAGTKLLTLSTKYSQSLPVGLNATGMVSCLVKHLPLVPGKYFIDVCCKLSEDVEDYREDVATISVLSGNFPGYTRLPGNSAGVFLTEHIWSSEK